jgi:hypothetical protein
MAAVRTARCLTIHKQQTVFSAEEVVHKALGSCGKDGNAIVILPKNAGARVRLPTECTRGVVMRQASEPDLAWAQAHKRLDLRHGPGSAADDDLRDASCALPVTNCNYSTPAKARFPHMAPRITHTQAWYGTYVYNAHKPVHVPVAVKTVHVTGHSGAC